MHGMCRPGMSPKDKTYKSIRNQNKILLERDVNSCSTGSSFNQEPIGQWQLQGLKWEPGGQRLSRPERESSHSHVCNGCQRSCFLNKYLSAINLQTHCKWCFRVTGWTHEAFWTTMRKLFEHIPRLSDVSCLMITLTYFEIVTFHFIKNIHR